MDRSPLEKKHGSYKRDLEHELLSLTQERGLRINLCRNQLLDNRFMVLTEDGTLVSLVKTDFLELLRKDSGKFKIVFKLQPLHIYCNGGTLVATLPKTPDLAVEATLGDALGQALHIPVRTAYKAFTRRWEWNQWMRLPLMISDLPRKAFLFLTVYDSQGECGRKVPIGGTHIPLFDSTGVLHQGQMDLRLWNDTQGSLTTPGHSKVESLHPEGENYEEEETRPDLAQLMNLTKQYRAGKIAHVDWLDRLTFAQVEKRKEKEKTE
ncbi:PIK3C3 [Lepeophtheirus salmonis]|uniref:PIK3C3 n=1 Tax=Lepeophtheirus salmonis TaxID=72036 RepID=A0A7R8H9G2_LEPSM|nr:PIK3C3 [Lepeophtheirus salmonis]CAF2949003.1 PIK3C3 [Lepeophtheirus salmonis]